MAKKNLLGNIIGQGTKSQTDQGNTISDEASNNPDKGIEQPRKTNGGAEVPPVQIVDEPSKETPIVKEKPIVQAKLTETPIVKETLVMSHPVKQEPIETKNVSGSILISPDEMTYIDQLVKHKRMSGYTDYTKKEALSEALTLLMDKYPVHKLLS